MKITDAAIAVENQMTLYLSPWMFHLLLFIVVLMVFLDTFRALDFFCRNVITKYIPENDC